MTFKECRKQGREFIIENNIHHCYMYQDKNGDYTFSKIYYNTMPPKYVLEKNGVVNKITNGHWVWDYQKRGMYPKNKKGWNKRSAR